MILDRYTTITIGTGNNALVISPTSENDVGIASGSLMLDQKIVDGDLEFGRLMSSEFSAQLFNTNQDFQGEPITADVTEDNVTTRIFTGVIESSKQDWSNTYRDIIAYDWIYYHREDNIASWWNSFWVSTRTQATVKQIRDSLLTYMGFSALSDTYINDSQVIKNEFQQFTNIKFETIFKMLCEIQLTIPHIKGDGSFELITFGTTTTDISGMYEGSNSEWEDFTTQRITGIGIYDTSSNMVQLVGTNTNVLNIAGNLFLLNMSASQLTTIGNNMLTALTDFTFVPASVKMILSDFSLSLGKKVSTDVGNTYVMQNTYSGSLLVEQTIKGVAYSDVLNGNVPSINDDLITANKIAVVQHDIDGLSTEFGRLENNLENNYSTTTEMNSAIEQSAEGIRTEVSQTYVNQTTYNAEVQRLQDEIDGAIESYTGSAVPTLNNYPANEWTTTTERDKHLGDLYLVNASGGSYAGFYYRFDKSGSTYSWVHIPDNEVQKALADAAEANQKAEAAQATADGIADDLSDNYSTTTQMNSAINQKAGEITQTVSTTYETKSDATSKLNTANTNAQGYANTAQTNAVNTAKSYTDAQLQITSSSILSTVEQGYTSKTEFNNLSIGGENVLEYSKNFELINTYIMTQQGAITTNAEGFTEAEQRGNGNSWIENYMRLYLDATDKGLVGKDITISIDFKTNDISKIGNMFCSWGSQDASGTRVGDINIAINSYKTVDGSALANNKWTRIYYTFRVETIANNSRYYIIQFKINNAIPSGTSMYYRKPKVEIGNRPTDWSPALYDIQPVGTNLLRYAPKSKTPTSYLALSLNLTEKLVKGQTYTLQLWDIDISHTGKQASELNVSVYAGGGNNVLTTITGFTNGHADYKVATFTVSSDSQLDNLWLNIYNSVPNASGTLNLTIGSWKLEKGNRATEWQMNPIDASSKSEVEQLANKVAVKVNSSGRLVTAALGVDPDTSTSYVKVKADDIDIIANGNIQLTGKSIGITSTNFSVTPAGSITAKAGTIGGWSIDSEKLYKSGTVSGITYASYLKANELKISSGLSTLSEFEQTIIRSGSMQLIGQSGNPMKNIIIDGDGEESPGTGIGYIQTPRLVTSLIEPQVDNEVNIAGAMTVKSNGKVSTTNDITSGGELISGYGMELGMASANAAALIDFHWASNNTDFTARIWQRGENTVDLIGKNSSTWGIWRAASFNSQSSKYVKKNIKDVTEKEARNILKLRPVKFDYKNSDLTNQRGLIAEEVLEVMPEMVSVPKDYTGFNKDEPWNTPSIDYSKFVPYLIKMIQIQQKDIDALKNK